MKMEKILVSRCLLGYSVRYDGKYQGIPEELEPLRKKFEFIPVCPETEFGFPVPRPPLVLVEASGGVRLRRRDDQTDFTADFARWCVEFCDTLPPLYAAVLKAKSPSCGLRTTKIYSESGALLPERATGLLAAELVRRGVKVFDENNFFCCLPTDFVGRI